MIFNTEQNYDQFMINDLQQDQVELEKKKQAASILIQEMTIQLYIMKVSDMAEFFHRSENFQGAQMIEVPKLLQQFEDWVKKAKQLEAHELMISERQAKIYLTENVFRFLLESLQIYMKKGKIQYLRQLESTILEWSVTNQKNLIDFQEQIFSNQQNIENICKYVEQEIADNIPQDMDQFYKNHFKRFWHDFSYPKLRQFNKELPESPQKSIYHKIQQLNQMYFKVAEQILHPITSNILLDIQKQSSDIMNGQFKQVLNQESQDQQKGSERIQQQQQQIKYYPIQNWQDKQFQDFQKFNQSELSSNLSDLSQSKKEQENLQKQIKNQQEIQKLVDQDLIKKKQSDNQILLRKNLQPKQLQITISEISEKKRIKKATQILRELIYRDLGYQILQGIELDIELKMLYNYIDQEKQLSNSISSNQQCFINLYGTKAGKKYLNNLLDKQQISKMVNASQQEIDLIEREFKKLRKILVQKNKNQAEDE